MQSSNTFLSGCFLVARTQTETGRQVPERTLPLSQHGFAQSVHPDACPTTGDRVYWNTDYAGKNRHAVRGQYGINAADAIAGTPPPNRTCYPGGSTEQAGGDKPAPATGPCDARPTGEEAIVAATVTEWVPEVRVDEH